MKNMTENTKKNHQAIFTANKDLIRLSIITIVVFILMSALRPSMFLRINNIESMGYQIAELGIYSLAMMFSMLSGGIDLSIVGISNLGAILAAYILHNALEKGYTGMTLWLNIIFAVLVTLLIGVLCGAFNGLLIAKLGLKPMLATLGTMNLYTGIAIIITNGKSISKLPKEYLYFGNHTFLKIPIPLWILILVIIGCMIILYKTVYGFQVKFIGSNLKASIFTGIKTKSVLFRTYILTGILCSIASLVALSRTGSAKADYGTSYISQAILCCVLGATNPDGGYARIPCLLLALVSLQFLSSGFSMLRLSGYFTDFAWGALLLIVLAFDYFSSKHRIFKRLKK